MKKCVSLILAGIFGLVMGIGLARDEGEIQVAGRTGPELENILSEDGHRVTLDHGISRIQGDRTALGDSLSVALERELLRSKAHRENIESYHVTGYKKKILIVSPHSGPYLQEVHTQGSLEKTDNPFHLAIEGPGFFRVSRPDGQIVYTRAGDFHFDGPTQSIKTAQNCSLGVEIPSGYCNVTVSLQGEVRGLSYGSGEPDLLGQLELAAFDHPENLIALGGGLYQEHPDAGPKRRGRPGDGACGLGVIAQGHLERSNVDFDYQTAELAQSERRADFLHRCLTSVRSGIVTY